MRKLISKKLATVLALSILQSTLVFAADVYIPKSKILEQSDPSYYIVSIGINNYVDPYWQTLKWPASDATRIADRLGSDTNVNRTTRLIINETATLENVKKTLADVSQQAGPNDTVIFYISGHGTLAQTASGELERVFLLHDSNQQDLFNTALPFSTLQRWLEGLNSRKNLMILATCHSGEGKSRLPTAVQQLLSSRKGKLVALSDVSEGALILTAAAHGEAARENDKLQGDIYTYYLLEALNVFDRNKDGVISALEAHDYARDRTWIFTNGKQRPTANIKLIGDADIPLMGTKNGNGLPILEAYNEDLAGFFVKIDENIKGRLPSAFPLNPQGSNVELYTPGGQRPIARYRVNANSGQRLSLRRIINHRPLRIDTAIIQSFWDDSFWNKLTGSSVTHNIETSATYFLGDFGVGLIIDSPTNTTRQQENFIETSVKLRSQFLTAEHRFYRKQWSFITHLEIGRETLSVKILDVSVNSSMKESSETVTSMGLSFTADLKMPKDFYLSTSIGIRNAEWELGELKNVSGLRRWFRIGINYQFAGIARTL